MQGNYSKTRLKREVSLLEETIDRDGHWERSFPCRGVIWPSVENWAVQQGYRLVSLRGQRRLYRLGQEDSHLQTYLEIRQTPNKVILKGWFQASFWARALRLFRLPPEMPVDPRGWPAARYRRRVCRGLNALLAEFQQPPIVQSGGFHWADLDGTTLLLMALLWIPPLVFASLTLPSLELHRLPYSAESFEYVGRVLGIPLGVLAGLGAVSLLIQQGVVVRSLPFLWTRAVSAVILAAISFTLSLDLTKTIGPRDPMIAVAYHCVEQFEESACREALRPLEYPQRRQVLARLRFLGRELVQAPVRGSSRKRTASPR